MGALYENGASQLVSPMISDLAVRLTARQQAIVGRWAIKTTLLLGVKDAIDSGSNSNPARLFLLRLNDEGAPPDGSSVRVGRYPAAEDDPEGETANLGELLPGGPPPKVGLYGVHTLGYLAFEVIVGNSLSTLQFIARTEDSDRLIRIWPPNIKGVDYPPRHILTRTDVAAMRNALSAAMGGTHTRRVWGPNVR
jgi:hypothetical protein